MSLSKKINVVVAGATGYVGLDLIKLLSNHPNVNIKYLCAQKNIGKKIQRFNDEIRKKLPNISKLKLVKWEKIDVLFTSLPTGEAQKLIKELVKYKNLKFIDLSADFRIKNIKTFKKYYGFKHKAKSLVKNSIYSISEFVEDEIKKHKIISCPGCYPTSIQLPLVPLLKQNLIKINNIVIDSKSGYSGAGKNLSKKFNHKNLYSSIHPYGVYNHRHQSEINQELWKINKKIKYTFTPHLIPTFRGLLSAIYVDKKSSVNLKKIHNVLKKFYKNKYFIKVANLNKNIGTENVINTNFCEISVCKLKIKDKILIFSAIDNLVKGAGGQAVQNMNIAFGLNEKIGLT